MPDTFAVTAPEGVGKGGLGGCFLNLPQIQLGPRVLLQRVSRV
jgi:hypothetical protein